MSAPAIPPTPVTRTTIKAALSGQEPATAESLVTWSASSDFSGAALFNPDSSSVTLDYYLDYTTGALALSASAGTKYHTTGFMPVTPGVTYRRSNSSGAFCWYSKDKAFISGASAGSTMQAPAGAYYIRCSTPRSAWSTFAFTVDTGSTAKLAQYGNRPFVEAQNPTGLGRLRMIKTKLMQLLDAQNVRAVFALAGDSYTQGATRWSGPFTKFMTAKYGDGGGGYCGFGFTSAGTTPYTVGNQPANKNGNPRPATYPTMIFGAITTQYNTASTPDGSTVTMSAAGDYVFQAFPASPVHNACDLFFVGVSGSQVKYRWGTYTSGAVNDPASYTWGSNTTISLAGTTGQVGVTALSGIPSGQGALIFEWVAGAPKLGGVNLKSAASGVVVHKIAGSGSQVYGWSQMDATSWQTGIAALAPDVLSYMDGPNSQTSSVAPGLWGDYLDILVNRARTAIPGLDVLIATPPENIRSTNRVSIMSYAKEARLRAARNRCAYLDHQPAWGDGGNASEYGASGINPLFNADDLHPEPGTGGLLLCREFMRTFEPTSS